MAKRRFPSGMTNKERLIPEKREIQSSGEDALSG
jgi:hypothetical protein